MSDDPSMLGDIRMRYRRLNSGGEFSRMLNGRLPDKSKEVGLFIRSDDFTPIGSLLEISTEVFGEAVLSFAQVVSHSRDEEVSGIGVHFVEFHDADLIEMITHMPRGPWKDAK